MRLLPRFRRRPSPTSTELLLAALAPLTAICVPGYATLTVEATVDGVQTYGCSDGQTAALLAVALRGVLEGEKRDCARIRVRIVAAGQGEWL